MNLFIKFVLLLLTSLPILSSYAEEATKNKPRVSIITSLYKGDEFLEGFLASMTQQTIFNESELIIINANSPGNEEPLIRQYMQKYPNIIYERLEADPGIYAVWNLAIKKSSADFITNANLDDRRNPEALALQVQELENNPSIDLVYSDFLVTPIPNETFEEIYKKHLKCPGHFLCTPSEFSLENMRRCLGGPHPVWRKSMHERCGLFSENFFSSGDFEMWNRAASHGCIFKKAPGISGVFYYNPNGLSTKPDSKQPIEDKFVIGAYSYLWNNKARQTPRLLIKIASRSNADRLFQALDQYYKNLSGQVPYHILLTLDETDSVMHTPKMIEKLRTYPNLSFYYGPWTSTTSAYNRDLNLENDYEVLLMGSDDLLQAKPWYDNIIIDEMQTHFPNYDGVVYFKESIGEQQENVITMGKKYFDQFGSVYHPDYKNNHYKEELFLTSKILGKEITNAANLFARPASESIQNQEDDKIYNQRRQKTFHLSDDILKEDFPKLWSILICTIEGRNECFNSLLETLKKQIRHLKLTDSIEIISFKDNREHSVGYKRNQLLKHSKSKYVCFIDDDDQVSGNYIQLIHERLLRNPDCVSLIGIMTTNGENPKKFIHSLDYSYYFFKDNIYYRPPNHVNPMKRAVAIQFDFPESNYGEDLDWTLRVSQSGLLKKEEKVEEPYYFYLFVDNK